MSGAMENRSAVFTSSPQDVEVYRNGAWKPGSLLGWRHDADGGCQVRVRLAAVGADEYWSALEYLRLPAVELSAPVVEELPAVDSAITAQFGDSARTATMAAIRSVPNPNPRAAATPVPTEITATISPFPAPRSDETVLAPPQAPRSGGRRRAPESATASADPVVDGGPEAPGAAAGRHRAPAPMAGSAGRHRAADSGVRPAVRQGPMAEGSVRESARADVIDAHLLTRPMRLDDLPGRVPQPRRPALDGRLAGR